MGRISENKLPMASQRASNNARWTWPNAITASLRIDRPQHFVPLIAHGRAGPRYFNPGIIKASAAAYVIDVRRTQCCGRLAIARGLAPGPFRHDTDTFARPITQTSPT